MLDLTLEDAAAVHLVHGAASRVGRPEQLLDLLVDRAHEYEQELFDTNGHGAWPALDEKTVQMKGSSQILRDSGDLLEDLTSNHDQEGEDATVTTSVPYAGYLKAGTGRMPRRDPAPEPPSHVTARWAADLLDLIVDGHR